MIREELEPSPVNLWRWGMENGLATPNTQPQDLVYLHLLPRESASIQRGGICFKGMYYVCAYAIERNWFARARRDGRRTVDVWYDPNDTTHVWLQDDERNFVRCDLLASEERVAQRRLEEVIDMLHMTNTPTGESTYAALNDRIRLDAHIGAVVGQAQMDKREALTATPVPMSRQTADIKKHRAFEKAAERQRPVTSLGADQYAVDSPRTTSDASSIAEAYAGERGGEVLSLLERLRDKGKRS
ncbi:MAG: Mu transposase C-terminal domain-containing protein [Burkholderia gladioli]